MIGRRSFIFIIGLCFPCSKVLCCTSKSSQYQEQGKNVTIKFQARTINSQNSDLLVTNQILSPSDRPLLAAVFSKGALTYLSACYNCTFTGNAATGDLSIRLDNLQTSEGGTYKHVVVESSKEVKGCVIIHILGKPIKPSITINKIPLEGESVTLTCSSTSTTTPRDPNLRMMYNWKVDNKTPRDTRFTFSDTKNQLTISNVGKNDANKLLACTAKEDVSNAVTSTNSEPRKIVVYYKPEKGPLIQGFNNNSQFDAILNRQQTLTCSVIGGYPVPSLSWSCFTGTGQDLSSGRNVSKTWTWTATSRGACKCISTQSGSADTFTLDVRILSPPSSPTFSLYSQSVTPSSTVKIIRDSTESITCSATSFPPPSYKWTFNNGKQTEVSQEATLNPSQVTKDGSYYCNVQNTMTPSQGNQETGSNSAFIDIQQLYPPSEPELRYHDENGRHLTGSFNVAKEDTFSMYCSSTGNPSPQFLWTGDGRNIKSQIIAVTKITQDRSYTCGVTNTMDPSFINSVTRSSSCTVSVSVLSPATSPTIRYHYSQSGSILVTSIMKVIKRKSFSLSCASTGIPTPTLTWSGPKDSNTDTLVLTSIQEDGNYSCTASNYMNRTFGKKETINSMSSLHVQVLYAPTVKPFNIEPLVEGSMLSVKCNAEPGNPTETAFSWKRKLNSSSMTSWQDIPESSINGGQLDKSNINRNDAGIYKCTASNEMKPTAENIQIGSTYQTFLLNVLYKASISSFYEADDPAKTEITRNENSTINLTCTVDSNPSSTIYIFKDSTFLETWNKSKQISFTNERVTCDSAGTYSCVGFNQYNVEEKRPSKELRLFVTCSPRLSSEDFNGKVRSAVGEQAILTIKITAYPVPKQDAFVWSKRNANTWNILTDDKNIKINTSGLVTSLVFLRVKVSDFQQYRMNVTNDYGTFYKEFYLQPYGKPNPPENVVYMDGSIKQTSIIITWTPGFHGGLSQTFHIQYKQQRDSNWKEITIPDDGTSSINTTLTGLESGTTYVFQMFSSNSEGKSNVTTALTFTTIGQPSAQNSHANLIGGLTGGIVAVVAVVLMFGVYMYRNNIKLKGFFKQNDENRKSLNGDLYLNLQNIKGGTQLEIQQVPTSNVESTSARVSDVYTDLRSSMNDNTEHIYKGLEHKTTSNDDRNVYENLKIR